MRNDGRVFVVGALLAAALLLLFILNMAIGSVKIPLSQILSPSGAYREILYIIRLPEGVGAIIVGVDLAVAGAVMQGLFRNPLADPYITGTGAGAVLGSILGLAAGLAYAQLRGVAIMLQPVLGFAGAMAATLMVIVFSRRGNWLTLVLAGISISILLSALVTLADSYILSRSQSSFSIFLLLFGSLESLTWANDYIMAAASIPVLAYIMLSGRKLNLIMTGDEVSASSGLRPHRFRTEMLVASGMLTSLALSFTGIIGFVGLIAPHLARFTLKSSNNVQVLPICALIGASLLLFANFTSKIIVPESVVPITAVTSLIGAPVLVYLIEKGSRHG